MKKTATRKLAEKIQALTGESLVSINSAAMQMVQMGLVQTREEALQEILASAQECK